MRIENLQNENRKYAKSIENFHVLEYVQDASVSPMNAMNEYFMSKMNVRRRQVVIDIDIVNIGWHIYLKDITAYAASPRDS